MENLREETMEIQMEAWVASWGSRALLWVYRLSPLTNSYVL